MRSDRQEALARERRWARPVALASFGGVALLVGSAIAFQSVRASEAAEFLAHVNAHTGAVWLSTALAAAGFVLLIAPLAYLFRAAQARSNRVRGQLLAAVVAAPLFVAVQAGLGGALTTNAASDFAAGRSEPSLSRKDAARECGSERKDKGAKAFGEAFESGAGGPTALGRCIQRRLSNDSAENALSEASPHSLAAGFELAGRLGLAFALAYTCLWSMRVGLLSRFWGSLGIALGIAVLLLGTEFTLILFFYLGLLSAGWVPGGRPPAWAAGEAVPWPTPGERAAEALAGEEEQPVEGEPVEVPAGELPPGGERRKRKRRT